MMPKHSLLMLSGLFLLLLSVPSYAESDIDAGRDILVTFDNSSARSANGGVAAPYRNRKRYSIANSVRRSAAALAKEYGLTEVDHWPIQALSVYCFVYRVAADSERSDVLAKLADDDRVESAQALNLFDTATSATIEYDDTYANLQHGLAMLDIAAAHQSSVGEGVRIAIVDSHIDENHEDLDGRISRRQVFSDSGATVDAHHGTAIASIIGARSNNALGIVGIAPGAKLEGFVSCWKATESRSAVCDSFSLLKAMDAMLDDPPQVLNLSLTGPEDPLLRRMLLKIIDAGVVVVAACPLEAQPGRGFPASMDGVIGVARSEVSSTIAASAADFDGMIFAPGDRILVAVPDNAYDFKSGSSLSAAHVSGVVALLLAVSPELSSKEMLAALRVSQDTDDASPTSVNACKALRFVDQKSVCPKLPVVPAIARTKTEH